MILIFDFSTLIKQNRKHKMTNLFTPLTPARLIFGWLVAIAVLLPNLGIAQTFMHSRDSTLAKIQPYKLQAIDSYESSWLNYCSNLYQSKDWELKETKNKWWYYLPSVGISFGMPSVQFGTGVIATIDKDNRNRKLKRLQLHAENKLNYNEGLQKIKIMYERIQQKVQKLDNEFVMFILHDELWKITKQGFEKGDLTPKEKIEAEISFEEKRNNLLLLGSEIKLMILDLEEYSRYKMPNRQFHEYSGECILESSEFQKLQDVQR